MAISLHKNDKILIAIIFGGLMMTGIIVLSGFQAGKQLSEINSKMIYVTPPNRTGIQNALDSVNSPVGGSQKLLLNTQINLLDSFGHAYPSSTYTNIPLQSLLKSLNLLNKLTLTDAQGHILDLGTVQIGLNLVTNTDNTQVIATGEMWVYLDGVQVSHKTFSANGITQHGGVLPLSVGDFISSSGSSVRNNQKTLDLTTANPAYIFTFADEGKNWADKSTHHLTAFVGNVLATVGNDQNSKIYQYSQSAIVYDLTMTLDGTKKVVIGLDNKPIQVPLSDVTLEITNTGALIYQPNGIGYCRYCTVNGSPTFPKVSVLLNGFTIGQLNSVGKIENIPRKSLIEININGVNYPVQTPDTSYNYIIKCMSQKHVIDSQDYDRTSNYYYDGYSCTSEFGYSGSEKLTGSGYWSNS